MTATLTLDGTPLDLPVKSGTIGPDVIDITHLYRDAKVFTYDPGFTSTASCELKITYIDGDEGILLHRGYPIEQFAEQGDFIETCYLLYYGELPTPAQTKEFEYRHHAPHHGARADGAALPGFPARCASHGCHGRRGRRHVRLLSRLDRHHRSAPARDRLAPDDRQAADHRGDGLQVPYRPALHLSAQQPLLRRELPAHVLRGALRGVQGEPDPGARHGPHLHPACRPRAERLDLHRAARGIFRAPIPSPASPLASPASGGPPMAAPTKRR